MPEVQNIVQHVTGAEHGDAEASTAAHHVIKALPREQLDQHLFAISHWAEAGGWFGTCRVCGSSVLVIDHAHAAVEVAA